MTNRRQDLDEESAHWIQYQQQQEDAARRCGAWDHADEATRTWPELIAAIAYTALAVVLVLVIIGWGYA